MIHAGGLFVLILGTALCPPRRPGRPSVFRPGATSLELSDKRRPRIRGTWTQPSRSDPRCTGRGPAGIGRWRTCRTGGDATRNGGRSSAATTGYLTDCSTTSTPPLTRSPSIPAGCPTTARSTYCATDAAPSSTTTRTNGRGTTTTPNRSRRRRGEPGKPRHDARLASQRGAGRRSRFGAAHHRAPVNHPYQPAIGYHSGRTSALISQITQKESHPSGTLSDSLEV
jgi:hypothetical protein